MWNLFRFTVLLIAEPANRCCVFIGLNDISAPNNSVIERLFEGDSGSNNSPPLERSSASQVIRIHSNRLLNPMVSRGPFWIVVVQPSKKHSVATERQIPERKWHLTHLAGPAFPESWWKDFCWALKKTTDVEVLRLPPQKLTEPPNQMNGWKMNFPTLGRWMAYFQGRTVRFREGTHST